MLEHLDLLVDWNTWKFLRRRAALPLGAISLFKRAVIVKGKLWLTSLRCISGRLFEVENLGPTSRVAILVETERITVSCQAICLLPRRQYRRFLCNCVVNWTWLQGMRSSFGRQPNHSSVWRQSTDTASIVALLHDKARVIIGRHRILIVNWTI